VLEPPIPGTLLDFFVFITNKREEDYKLTNIRITIFEHLYNGDKPQPGVGFSLPLAKFPKKNRNP
jgi:hypothetical protein